MNDTSKTPRRAARPSAITSVGLSGAPGAPANVESARDPQAGEAGMSAREPKRRTGTTTPPWGAPSLAQANARPLRLTREQAADFEDLRNWLWRRYTGPGKLASATVLRALVYLAQTDTEVKDKLLELLNSEQGA